MKSTPPPARPHDPASREFERTLATALESLGLSLDPRQRRRMVAHYRLLADRARRFNLTRITAPADAAVKHYADSLALLACLQAFARRGARVLDVGAGAGFPSVPLAIARDDWQVTAIDGTAKKVRFVGDCAERLGLANLRPVCVRCEDFRPGLAGFDLICFRAVGKLAECFRLARPLLAGRGVVVCWKAAKIDDAEWRAAERIAKRLGLCAPVSWAYELDGLPRRRLHQLVTARSGRASCGGGRGGYNARPRSQKARNVHEQGFMRCRVFPSGCSSPRASDGTGTASSPSRPP